MACDSFHDMLGVKDFLIKLFEWVSDLTFDSQYSRMYLSFKEYTFLNREFVSMGRILFLQEMIFILREGELEGEGLREGSSPSSLSCPYGNSTRSWQGRQKQKIPFPPLSFKTQSCLPWTLIMLWIVQLFLRMVIQGMLFGCIRCTRPFMKWYGTG